MLIRTFRRLPAPSGLKVSYSMATAASRNLGLRLVGARGMKSSRNAGGCRNIGSISSISGGVDAEQKRGVTKLAGKDAPERIFVHISPSGDFWLGEAIFAAKHLSSDYLRSIPLQPGSDADQVEKQMQKLTISQLQAIYDSGQFSPPDARQGRE